MLGETEGELQSSPKDVTSLLPPSKLLCLNSVPDSKVTNMHKIWLYVETMEVSMIEI